MSEDNDQDLPTSISKREAKSSAPPQENNLDRLKMSQEQQTVNDREQVLGEAIAARGNLFEVSHQWTGETSRPQPKPVRRFKSPEERMRWRAKMRGTLPPGAESAENSDRPLLDYPVLLTPLEFQALTQVLPVEERRRRLGAMTSLRKRLWDLVRAENAQELSKIYEHPTTVETIKAALEATDLPKINRK